MIEGLLLTSITFLPLVGGLLLLSMHKRSATFQKGWTVAVLIVDLLLSLLLWFRYPTIKSVTLGETMMAFEVKQAWLQFQDFSINYHLGVDGLSLLLVLLTSFLGPVVLLATWDDIQDKVGGYCFSLLFLQTGALGALMALDLFLFFIFWEAIMIPMYFILGIWGERRRIYATMKILLYTLFGSTFLLIAMIYIGMQFGTLNVLQLYGESINPSTQLWLFLCFALAFMVKVPLFPFHTWLPDAQSEAPIAGSVILTAVLLKLGAYGFVRFAMPLFPDALQPLTQPLMILAVFGIVYGALLAMVQPDIKKRIAYSSISHLGLIMLGILCMNPQGVQGGILHMLNHGLSTGALLLLLGMLYQRRKTSLIADFGGLARTAPLFAFFLLLFSLSIIGLPGLNGFVGEFLILVGTFGRNQVYTIIAGSGMVLSAVYMLWMFQRVAFGPLTRAENHQLTDLNPREVGLLLLFAMFVIWIGVFPSTFLNKSTPSVHALLRHVQSKRTPKPTAALRIVPNLAPQTSQKQTSQKQTSQKKPHRSKPHRSKPHRSKPHRSARVEFP